MPNRGELRGTLLVVIAAPLLPWGPEEWPAVVAAGLTRSIPFVLVLAALAWLGRRPRQQAGMPTDTEV